MQKYGLAAMCMAVLLLSHGCATPKKDTAMSMAQLRGSYEELLSSPEDNETGDRIISRARTMIGTPYVRGGRNPGGFDCSGLVQWAYKREGIVLPRTAREQSQVGTRITDVESMRAGDIVAFRHPRRGYHTGIYVGDGKFIHSPHRRDRVKISSLDDPYFRTTFLGARRVSADAAAVLAQAGTQLEGGPDRLVEYREEQAVRELRKSRQERAEREAARKDKNSRSKKERAVAEKSSRKDKSGKAKVQRETSKKKAQASREKSARGKSAREKSRKTTASREKSRSEKSAREKTRKTASREKSRSEKSARAKSSPRKETARNDRAKRDRSAGDKAQKGKSSREKTT